MKTPGEIEELTSRALNSLDNMQPAEANEYLYSKIRNRMQQNRQNNMAVNTRLLFRLSAALILFLFINAAGLYFMSKQSVSKPAKTNGIDAFSEAYFPKTDSYNY